MLFGKIIKYISHHLVPQSPYINPYIQLLIKYRYIILALAAFGVWFDKNFYIEKPFIGLYVIIMIFFGLMYLKAWQGIHQSFLVTLCRFYAAADGFPVAIDVFFFQWFSYFAIWFAVSLLVKKNIEQKENLISITKAFVKTLDSRDSYTADHSENVARYSELIAREMGLSDKAVNLIRLGAYLHDIGKIGIPEGILNKPSKLTQEEYNSIKCHSKIGFDLLKDVKEFKKNGVLDAILYHHEREDGSGYPFGLKNEEIPLISKIIAVADSFDAIKSKRVYKDKISMEYALNEIILNKGNLYDSKVVEAFKIVVEREDGNLFEIEESSEVIDYSI